MSSDFALVQYPMADRRNEENLVPFPTHPDVGNGNRMMLSMSSGFALGMVRPLW